MPVHFACPQCRQLLKISRRKIGTICECPRCGNPTAVPAPTTTKRELAHSSSSRLESVPSSGISLFDDVNELLAQGPTRPAAVGSESTVDTRRVVRAPAVDSRWSQPPDQPAGSAAEHSAVASRTRTLIQGGLLCLVAATAFAAGYLLGHGRSTTPSAAAVATTPPVQQPTGTIPSTAPSADWPTPTR
jgi:DNA-directed RNA polymerase subunit M/transcription elongation factor TFIIS